MCPVKGFWPCVFFELPLAHLELAAWQGLHGCGTGTGPAGCRGNPTLRLQEALLDRAVVQLSSVAQYKAALCIPRLTSGHGQRKICISTPRML